MKSGNLPGPAVHMVMKPDKKHSVLIDPITTARDLNSNHLGETAVISSSPIHEEISGQVLRVEHFKPKNGIINYLGTDGQWQQLQAERAVSLMINNHSFTVSAGMTAAIRYASPELGESVLL